MRELIAKVLELQKAIEELERANSEDSRAGARITQLEEEKLRTSAALVYAQQQVVRIRQELKAFL